MKILNGPQTPQMLRMINFIFRPLEYLETNAQLYGETFKVGGRKSPGAVYLVSC